MGDKKEWRSTGNDILFQSQTEGKETPKGCDLVTTAERRLERPFGEVAMGLRGSTTN